METAKEPDPNVLTKIRNALGSAITQVLGWRILVIWIACSILAAYSGPFGTYQSSSLVVLFVTWLVLLGAGITVAYIIHELCKAFLNDVSDVVFNGIFFTTTSITLGLLLDLLLSDVLGHPREMTPSRLELIFYALIAMCFILIVRLILGQGEHVANNAPETKNTALKPASLPPHSRLAKRLDIPQTARIAYVTAKGHFVEVQTCLAVYSTRMRFSDAVDELDGTCGLTVHRSHWVHCDAIKGWVPTARKPYIVLENDMQIPVSKTNLSKVEEAELEVLPDTLAVSA